jgi:ubiquinone/menaquinone biosynthesis C-methylase UbiE
MFKWGFFMAIFKRNVESERNFEKKHILKLKDHYLETDVMKKVASDDGYRDKIKLIEQYLTNENGWILDIGSNTCGESEYLSTKGLSIICTDVNEYALDISRQRATKYGRNYLKYAACDAHHFPFKDNSIDFVTLIESLHHMVNPEHVLREVKRVLVPSGKVLLYEPYAYNPYRRISEIRDYFKGTIEKSFGINQLNRMLKASGLTRVEFNRHVSIPSSTKLNRVSPARRFLKNLYYQCSSRFPGIFANVLMIAQKSDAEGLHVEKRAKREFDEILQCPITGVPLLKIDEGYENMHDKKKYRYQELNGIPILIPTEAIPS